MKRSQPPSKKIKLTNDGLSSYKEMKIENLLTSIKAERLKIAESVLDFDFKKKRIRVLTKVSEVKERSKGVVYWMSRDARVQDNWAFLFAQKLALKNKLPLHVCFCLVPKFLDATIRHFKFMLKGLAEVETECKRLNVGFHLLYGCGGTKIPEFVKSHSMGAVVCDFSPLRVPMEWTKNVQDNLPKDVPLCQVDAHNIVPVWVTSEKQEYAARTIRNKVNNNLGVYLQQFPPAIKHLHKSTIPVPEINWEEALSKVECDRTVDEVDWAKPGYEGGINMLQEFCEKRLCKFNDKRNDPLASALSNLSPWFHFGQIAVQRAILTVQKFKTKYSASVASFCEEAIVRRELADNFCFYNKNYDNLTGCAAWALGTLNDHRKDKRVYVYTREQMDQSLTHDDLWNSAQIQLRKEGKMHGFLRMYWAKKILEWSSNPDEALANAIYLNDRYSLDGRDPNGYVGCMWSIGGIHDQGWGERPIFGKIRFMNYDGCKRKFDVKAFVCRYGGKVHGPIKK